MPRIPNNLRERAIGMLDAGMSTEHVARHVGCSSQAIQNLCMRFRTTGSTNDLPHHGHLRGTMRGQDCYIMNTHLCNQFQTATATAANTPGLHNNRISAQIVRNRLRENGRKEGNVLFNNALNTFYFTVIWRRTYGKGPLR